MPKRKHPVFTVFDTDLETNSNKCQNCKSIIKGSHASNLKAKHNGIYTEIENKKVIEIVLEHQAHKPVLILLQRVATFHLLH